MILKHIASLPVAFKKLFILFLFQGVQLVNVLVLQSVFVSPVLRGNQSLLNKGFGIFGLFGNNAMLAEDIIPIQYSTCD